MSTPDICNATRRAAALLGVLACSGCEGPTTAAMADERGKVAYRSTRAPIHTRLAKSPLEALEWSIAALRADHERRTVDTVGVSATWGGRVTRSEVLTYLEELHRRAISANDGVPVSLTDAHPMFGTFPQGANTIALLGMSGGGRVVRFGLNTSCGGPGTGTNTRAAAEADIEVRELGNLYFATHWRTIEQPVWTSGAYESYIAGGEKFAIQLSTHTCSNHMLWPPDPISIPKRAERPI